MMRPAFSHARSASTRIYDPANSAAKVAKVVGGYVARNINHSNPRMRWKNTCAVRMSYILNQSGMPIPHVAGQTVSGAAGRWYFCRVKDLIAYLKMHWEHPEVVKYPPSGGGALAGKKGLILFEVTGWTDAEGHATLFNGSTCYDHCYFNEPEARYRTDRANFWSLP